MQRILYRIRAFYAKSELQYLKKRAKQYGYILSREKALPASETLVENYFNTEYKRNALLSYLVAPFIGKIDKSHSNYKECFAMAEILQELGYNVDIINWDNVSYTPTKRFDLIIDNHNNLYRLKPYLDAGTTKIFHATNAHWLYQNWVEYSRCFDFFLQSGKAISPPRIMAPGNNAEHSDVISMFGNEFTKRTFGKYANKVQHLPMSVNSDPEILEDRNIASAKFRFIWLNGLGALLKGLDIVVDAFKKLPQCTLYICGDLEQEKELLEVIQIQLVHYANIKLVGWVDINGDVFRKLATDCAWVIGNSFSEGGGGSTLNCMAKGLIPILSKSSSVDIKPNMGFYLQNNNAAGIEEVVKRVSALPDDDLEQISLNAYRYILANHTVEKFKESYKNFMLKIINEKKHVKSELCR